MFIRYSRRDSELRIILHRFLSSFFSSLTESTKKKYLHLNHRDVGISKKQKVHYVYSYFSTSYVNYFFRLKVNLFQRKNRKKQCNIRTFVSLNNQQMHNNVHNVTQKENFIFTILHFRILYFSQFRQIFQYHLLGIINYIEESIFVTSRSGKISVRE